MFGVIALSLFMVLRFLGHENQLSVCEIQNVSWEREISNIHFEFSTLEYPWQLRILKTKDNMNEYINMWNHVDVENTISLKILNNIPQIETCY